MKTISYACTHCGRRFEDEDKEIVECPGCYWSTSVKRQSDLEESKAISSSSLEGEKHTKRFEWPSFHLPWVLIFKVVLAILLILSLGVSFIAIKPALRNFFESRKKIHIGQTSSGEQESQKPELSGTLSEIEKKMLSQVMEISSENGVSEEAMQILKAQIEIKTGIIEKLPSQTWTLEQFREMLTEQERAYQIPLPRSYHKKLESLFTEKYLAAGDIFQSGDLLRARDLWMESLAFPIYADDLRKHRGVVLTMLRPLINDTLSKIGALNTMLAQKTVRDSEKQIQLEYEKFFDEASSKRWGEALAQAEKIENSIQVVESPVGNEVPLPPYPVAIASVDEGIRAALQDVLYASSPSVADFVPLKKDLAAKKDTLKVLIPEYTRESKTHYQKGVEFIQSREWQKAEQELSNVSVPPELAQDARQKIQIIQKLKNAALDSGSVPR